MFHTNSKSSQPSGSYLILYNNKSGRKKGKQKRARKLIQKTFNQLKQRFRLVDLENFDWQRLEKGYKNKKIKALVIAGGDGSLRTTSEILYRMGIDLPIGFIPLGSTNWVARSLNIPLDTKSAIKTIVKESPTHMDAGIVNNKKIFLLTACFGEIAKISIGPTRKQKAKLGFWAYARHLPILLTSYKQLSFKIRLKNEKSLVKAHSLMIINHLNLHKLKPQRKVLFNDGKLHYFALKNSTWRGLIRIIFEFYFKTKDSSKLKYKEMSELTITEHRFSSLAHLDGDKIELGDGPIQIKVIPNYVKIFRKN